MDNDLLRLDRRNITNLQKNLANVVKNSHYVFSEMSKSAADIQARIDNLDKKLIYLQKASDQYLNNPEHIEMLSRQQVPLARPSSRDRRRRHSGGNNLEVGQVSLGAQPLFLAELCADESLVNVEIERERLTEYRRHVKLVPVRREVLYYEGGGAVPHGMVRAGPTERRSRKMRRSRSMRDGELLGVPAKDANQRPMITYDSPVHHRRKSVLATCLGFLELRQPRAANRRRPHSVDVSERINFVPVLTAGSSAVTPSASIDMSEVANASASASTTASTGGGNEEADGEVQVRVKSVPTILVPVDVSGDAFERYCQLRRSLHGVEYQRVVTRRPRRYPRVPSPHQTQSQHVQRRHHRLHHSYDALEPQLQALQDPSGHTVVMLPPEDDPRRRYRHSHHNQQRAATLAAQTQQQQRLATVKRSSSMPATPPSSSCEFGSWRHSSDLASSCGGPSGGGGSSSSTGGATGSSSGLHRLRRTFSQRARDFFRGSGARSRSHSAENTLDGPIERGRSKSPFSWLFRGSTRDKAASVGAISASVSGSMGSSSLLSPSMDDQTSSGSGAVVLRHPPPNAHKSRDRAKKARTADPMTAAKSNGGVPEARNEPEQAKQRPTAGRPTAVDCPNYKDSLATLGRILQKRETIIPANFTGSEPLQGIPLHKVKVWLRSGRDVIRNRRALDRYSSDARPISVSVTSPDAVAPVTRSKSFFSRNSGGGGGSSSDRKRCSAQAAGQRAKQAFAGQCTARVSLSQSTSEHLDKLSHQFNRAVTLRRSYRHKRPDDRRSSSGNWSATSSSTRPSRASSAGAQARLPRSLSKDSALGMHCSSGDRSDMFNTTGAASSSSLSSLSTHRGGTPTAEHTIVYTQQSRLHYTVVHPCLENGLRPNVETIYALPNKPKFLSSVKESPSHYPNPPPQSQRYSTSKDDSDDVFDSTVVPDNSSTETLSEENLMSKSSPVFKRRVAPPPPPRVDSLRTVKRGVIVSSGAPAAAAASRKVLRSADDSPANPMTDSWYSELLPYKSNTLPRNLSTRLRKRDSLPSGGGIADMYNSWPRATTDSPDDEMEPDDEELDHRPSPITSSSVSVDTDPPRMASSSSSSSSVAPAQPSKSLNFAPHASLNVYDINTPTNACSAASTHRILKPQALPAAPEEQGSTGSEAPHSPPASVATESQSDGSTGGKRPNSPLLKQYKRLYSLNRAGGPEQQTAATGQRNGRVPVEKEGNGDSEYEDEATMV